MTWAAALLVLLAQLPAAPCVCVCEQTTQPAPKKTAAPPPIESAMTGIEVGAWVGPDSSLIQGSYRLKRWRFSFGLLGVEFDGGLTNPNKIEGTVGVHYTVWQKR